MKQQLISIKRLSLLFWIGLIVGVAGMIDSFVFLAWRWDKPLNNPSGPLHGMGSAVMVWEASGHTLVWMGGMCMLLAGSLRGRKVDENLVQETNQ